MRIKKISALHVFIITLFNLSLYACQSNNCAQNSQSHSDSNVNPPAEIKVAHGELSLQKINSCHDGDTCQVMTTDGFWFNVRLAGIDAPEVGRKRKNKEAGQPLGLEARDQLIKMTQKSKSMRIRQVDIDHFNRPVVEILVGDDCVNIRLLEMGLAERYRGNTKDLDVDRYDKAEHDAKRARRGIWGLNTYTPPSIWRKENKKH